MLNLFDDRRTGFRVLTIPATSLMTLGACGTIYILPLLLISEIWPRQEKKHFDSLAGLIIFGAQQYLENQRACQQLIYWARTLSVASLEKISSSISTALVGIQCRGRKCKFRNRSQPTLFLGLLREGHREERHTGFGL